MTLDVYRIPDRYPQLGTDFVTGVSRFVFDIAKSVDNAGIATGDLLPLEQRVSNAFLLTAPEDNPDVGCPDVPWLAEFEFYKTALTAPGTAELVVRTPDTVGPCGPGFSVKGVRFYADGKLLGEGVPHRWWSSGAPEAFRYHWQLAPGEDGVPEAGSATSSLTAEVVVQNAQGETRSVATDDSYNVEVAVREAPAATEAQRLTGTVEGWPGGEGVITAYMNQDFDFQAAIATGHVNARGDLELTLPAVLDEAWYGYAPFLPVTECPDAGATIGTLEGVIELDVTDPRPPEGPRQLGFLAEGSSDAAVANLLEAEVGEFVVIRTFASEAFLPGDVHVGRLRGAAACRHVRR